MKTSSAKAKGRRLASKVKDMLLEYAQDELKPDDLIITASGDTGEDLKMSPKARSIYPLSIECKNQEKLNIWSAIEQAKSHNRGVIDFRVPVVCFSKNNQNVYITLELEGFLKLVR